MKYINNWFVRYVVIAMLSTSVILLFSYYVYPTPYKYLQYSTGSDGITFPVRYNWITDTTEILRVETSSSQSKLKWIKQQ